MRAPTKSVTASRELASELVLPHAALKSPHCATRSIRRLSQWVTLSGVGCFGTLGLRMPCAGARRRGGHQDVYVQVLFCKVAESRAVDELDPIVLLGFDPASRREP